MEGNESMEGWMEGNQWVKRNISMNLRHTDSPNTVSQTLSPSPPLHSFHYQQTINTQQSWREAERTISAWKGLMLIPNTLRTSSKSKKNSHTIVLKDSDVSGSSVLNINASGDSRATTISSTTTSMDRESSAVWDSAHFRSWSVAYSSGTAPFTVSRTKLSI